MLLSRAVVAFDVVGDLEHPPAGVLGLPVGLLHRGGNLRAKLDRVLHGLDQRAGQIVVVGHPVLSAFLEVLVQRLSVDVTAGLPQVLGQLAKASRLAGLDVVVVDVFHRVGKAFQDGRKALGAASPEGQAAREALYLVGILDVGDAVLYVIGLAGNHL